MRTREEIYNALNSNMKLTFSSKDGILEPIESNKILTELVLTELLLDIRDQNEHIIKHLDKIYMKPS